MLQAKSKNPPGPPQYNSSRVANVTNQDAGPSSDPRLEEQD